MKRKTENYKLLYISDFRDSNSPLWGAIIEAESILQTYKPLYKGVRILSDTGRCIKIVKL
nr:MAG TPA: hypothetical protein [Caudoviricetes sp.]